MNAQFINYIIFVLNALNVCFENILTLYCHSRHDYAVLGLSKVKYVNRSERLHLLRVTLDSNRTDDLVALKF